MKKFTLVIPAKNEEKRMPDYLQRLYSFASKKFGRSNFEIIVVINRTTDNTEAVLRELKAKYSMTELKYYNIGNCKGIKGEAVLYGFRKAKGEIVGFVDADGSFSVADVFKVYRTLGKNLSVDAAVASRYVKNSVVKGDISLTRKIFGFLYSHVVRMLFGLGMKDTQCGLKFYRRKVILDVIDKVKIIDWSFDVNIFFLMKALQYKVKEVGVTVLMKDRSNVSIAKDALGVVKDLMTLWIEYQRLGLSALRAVKLVVE